METKLYVGNLANTTTAEDLRMLFSRAGMVVSVEVVKNKNTGISKGFAFIDMISQGDAGKAVSEFNGYRLDNRTLKVTVARPSEKQPNRRRKIQEYRSYNQSNHK